MLQALSARHGRFEIPAPPPPPTVAACSEDRCLVWHSSHPRGTQLQEQAVRITAELDAALGRPSDTAGGVSAARDNGSASSRQPERTVGRAPIAAMSAEVVDSNPYSRLMALQRMGIVKDYERIRDKTVPAK